jgi:hypothetical protein
VESHWPYKQKDKRVSECLRQWELLSIALLTHCGIDPEELPVVVVGAFVVVVGLPPFPFVVVVVVPPPLPPELPSVKFKSVKWAYNHF